MGKTHKKERIFGGLDFSAPKVAAKYSSTAEGRILYKIKKNDYKFRGEIEDRIKVCHELFDNLKAGEALTIMSNKLTMSEALRAYGATADEVHIGTFSLADAGIAAVKYVASRGAKVYILMDKAYLLKSNFRNGGHETLGEGVEFKFTKSHGKYLCCHYADGSVLNIVGSANMGANLRMEVYKASRDVDEYEFFKHIYGVTEDLSK